MAELRVSGDRAVAAPADRVYRLIANYREHHPRFLPPAFSAIEVEEGGVGAGTVIRFRVKTGGRTQTMRQRVAEPEPGRVLTESDGKGVTTFTVTPNGDGSHVRIETAWQPVGVQGFFERLFAPRVMRKLYADELERLDRYAQAHPEA